VVPRKKIGVELGSFLLLQAYLFHRHALEGCAKVMRRVRSKSGLVGDGVAELVEEEVKEKCRDFSRHPELYALSFALGLDPLP